jgi:sugar lactone lactonase YvrE
MSALERIGTFSLQWGESLRWDDRRERLYFVDCAADSLHWLEGGAGELHTMKLSSLPTGVVLCEDGRLVIALGDGLHVVDVDADTTEVLAPYPEGLGARANDANADLHGNLVTGTLNLGPGPGSYWWFSGRDGWRKLDDGIGNANGPVVLDLDGPPTLVFSDTFAGKIYAYPYDGSTGSVGDRRVYFDAAELEGMPDGACADASGGVWSCLAGAGKIVRCTGNGVDAVIDTGVELPSDVTFGGRDLDRMFFVSIALPITGEEITSQNAGALMAVVGTGYEGRPEPRFRL